MICFWNQKILSLLIFFYWFRDPGPILSLVLSCCYQKAKCHVTLLSGRLAQPERESTENYTGTGQWKQQSGICSVLGDIADTASLPSLVLETQSSCRPGYFCTITHPCAQPHADRPRRALGDLSEVAVRPPWTRDRHGLIAWLLVLLLGQVWQWGGCATVDR